MPRAAIEKDAADLSEIYKDSSHDESGPCDGCAESSVDDVCVLTTNSFTSADSQPVTSSLSDDILVGETDRSEDALKNVDSNVDPLQYNVLPDDSGAPVLSRAKVDGRAGIPFDSVPFTSVGTHDDVFVVKSDSMTTDDGDLVNMSDEGVTDVCLRQLSVLPQTAINSADDLELLADSFVSTDSIAFCSESQLCKELSSSSPGVTKTCVSQDGSCNGAINMKIRVDVNDEEVVGLLDNDADQVFMSDGVSADSELRDVGSEQTDENNLPLDVVEALFSRDGVVSSRT